MKVGQALIEAAKKQSEGEVAVHVANIKVYQTMPAGIGEHPQHIEEMDKLVSAMADAQDNLDIINKIYDDKQMLVD